MEAKMLEPWQLVLVAALLGAGHRVLLGGALRRPYAMTVGFFLYSGIICAATGNAFAAVVVSGITQSLWALGHGDALDMGTMPQDGDDWLRPVIDWLFGPMVTPNTDSAFWRDFAHMSLRYGIQTSGMAIALWPFGLPAPVLAASGLFGGVCYALTRTPVQRWFPVVNVGEPAIGAVVAGGLAVGLVV
jgi:hypothetical protein